MDYKEKLKLAKDWYNDQSTTKKVKVLLENLFPELKESKDERIRKQLLDWFKGCHWDTIDNGTLKRNDIIAWLEKQGEQKPTQEIESFEAKHGKYYYCIKDYFCGGRKQASKGDVVQALRGLPIMGLEDASVYFLPVNNVQNPAWSEEDEKIIETMCKEGDLRPSQMIWLKSLKNRVQQHWKPTEE